MRDHRSQILAHRKSHTGIFIKHSDGQATPLGDSGAGGVAEFAYFTGPGVISAPVV